MMERLKAKSKKYKLEKIKGITLISLVITIVVLIILASVAIYLSLGNNGIFTRSKQAKETTNKQTATEKINLKITTAQMNKYSEKQEMPTLKELSEVLKEDSEIQYVTEKSRIAVVEYNVPSENPSSIYTKLSEYPYEFEINSQLQLASIDGEKLIASTSNNIDYSDSKNELLFTQKVTAIKGWNNNIEGPEIPSGTWLIFASMTAGDNVESHSTTFGCTGCYLNRGMPLVGGNNHISGYYKGEKTNLILRIFNDSSTTKEYTLHFRILKLSDTY